LSVRDGERIVIVNADDFGRTAGINAGIARAHEHGIVTSASLMVRWPAAAEAGAYARANPSLGVGLHVDLGEWAYEDGRWASVHEVVALEDEVAVEAEVLRQLDSFRRLVGRDPTHLDSHQHVHVQSNSVGSPLRRLAGRLGAHVRRASPTVTYCGDFYGQTEMGVSQPYLLRPERLVEILAALSPGVTELACHPGLGPDIDSSYKEERELEVAALCDPRVRSAIESERITLCTFGDVKTEPPQA
jgi:predicted glycoside hydrolase/deacetylase ChbG (UPF0249 family)